MSLGFEHPFTCIIAGPTKSGKTEFVKTILQALPYYIHPCPTNIVWCYGMENIDQINAIKLVSTVNIDFIEGIPDLNIFSPKDINLLIIDDLMNDVGKSKQVSDLFTKGCHHRNISIILLVQNLFHQGPKMRDIHLSTNYLVLFKNPRDKTQISHLARQAFPENPKYLLDAYKKATSKPFGYLMIDFTQTTPDECRITSKIFPPGVCQTYLPKK
jgi:hypothetical protein